METDIIILLRYSFRKITSTTGCNTSKISRELKRNGKKGFYSPIVTLKLYTYRKQNSRRKLIYLTVEYGKHFEDWSLKKYGLLKEFHSIETRPNQLCWQLRYV